MRMNTISFKRVFVQNEPYFLRLILSDLDAQSNVRYFKYEHAHALCILPFQGDKQSRDVAV